MIYERGLFSLLNLGVECYIFGEGEGEGEGEEI